MKKKIFLLAVVIAAFFVVWYATVVFAQTKGIKNFLYDPITKKLTMQLHGGASVSNVSHDVGDVKVSIASSLSGWIVCNGTQSIGSSGSTGTLKGDRYRPLYDLIWAMPGTTNAAGSPFLLSAAKGATAAADWAANKKITIDFATNELFVRQDGSGTVLGGNGLQSTALPSTSFTTGNQSASHTHSGSTNTDGAHGHDEQTVDAQSPGSTGFDFFASNGSDGAVTIRNNGSSHSHGFTTGGISDSHTHTVNGGGDTETAPKHIALNYFIKY